jgi:hypothetical protein
LLCGRDAAAALNHHITTPLRKCFLDKIVSGNGDLSIELLNEILAEADREIEKSIPANQSERDRNPPPWSPKPVPPDLSVHSEPVTAYTDPPKEKEVPKTVDDGNQDGCCRCCCSTSNYAKVKDEKNKTSGKKDCCCCCEVA